MPHPKCCGAATAKSDQAGCPTLLWSPPALLPRVPQLHGAWQEGQDQACLTQTQAMRALPEGPVGSCGRPHLRWARREAQVEEILQGLLLHLVVGLCGWHGGLAHPLEVRLLRERLPLLCSWLCGRPACSQACSKLRRAALSRCERRSEAQDGGCSWSHFAAGHPSARAAPQRGQTTDTPPLRQRCRPGLTRVTRLAEDAELKQGVTWRLEALCTCQLCFGFWVKYVD